MQTQSLEPVTSTVPGAALFKKLEEKPEEIATKESQQSDEVQVDERKPKLGEIVLYRIATWDLTLQANGLDHGSYVPAIVVRVWSGTSVNLQAFGDRDLLDGPAWKTSITHGEHEGQYKFRD
jgi:hypothetical protein